MDVDAQSREPLHRVVRRDTGSCGPHVVHHGLEVLLRWRRAGANAVSRCGSKRVSHLRRAEKRLRWDTAVVETVPAHAMLLEQRDAGTDDGGTTRNGQAARAGA